MANQYPWSQIFGRDPKLRAADADREAVADRLRKSHTEGRLDMTEFQQRLERCYEAKTVGELEELLTDLPREEQGIERYPRGLLRPWRWRFVPLAPLIFAVLLISALSGHHHFFWLWIPLAFFIWRMCWWRRWWHVRDRGGSGEWM